MPLASRREEIDRFLTGDADVCVATDVLGHGVNLPCETLLFAETTKFDGKERRDLEPWEIAQIAGRAGRYGFHERGHVGVLTGLPWADPDPELVRAALVPQVPIENGHLGYRIVDSGRLRPQLSDLRESGAIEQDADLVMFIYRQEIYDGPTDKDGNSLEGRAEVIIGKQCNGPIGAVRLAFLGAHTKFDNLAMPGSFQDAY